MVAATVPIRPRRRLRLSFAQPTHTHVLQLAEDLAHDGLVLGLLRCGRHGAEKLEPCTTGLGASELGSVYAERADRLAAVELIARSGDATAARRRRGSGRLLVATG